MLPRKLSARRESCYLLCVRARREKRRWYSRLRLGGVIPQGNTLALDFVETLLTEVVPVSKKPIFW